jgi:hypothetical protein
MKSPKPNEESKRAWNWSLFISVLSFIVSGLAFWYASLAPADLKASLAGDLIFRWIPPNASSPPPAGYINAPMEVLAHLTFANNGAEMGVVKYFVVRLQDETDGTEWLLHPAPVVQDEPKVIECWGEPEGETQKDLCRNASLSSFHSLLLPGKQTMSQTYLCGYDPAVSTNVVLRPHTFHVTLYTLVSGESALRPQETGTLVLTPQSVDSMSKGISVAVQLEEVEKSIRKTFPEWHRAPRG